MFVKTGVIFLLVNLQYFRINSLEFTSLKNKEVDALAGLVQNGGYSVQVHNIWTEDGYRIRLHRILSKRSSAAKANHVNLLNYLSPNLFLRNFFKRPMSHSKQFKKPSKKLPILFVHGLLCSGSMWITNSSNSLAFLLTDAGYDVWLFSARGTSPSMQHKRWTISDPKFWDFSWHEIGYYDVTRTIDYILQKTKLHQLSYIGHSQGTTAFMVALSTRPEYNRKISLAVLLAPAAYLEHANGVTGYLTSTNAADNLVKFFNEANIHFWHLRQTLLVDTIVAICQDPFINTICAQGVYAITGEGSEPDVNVYGMVIDLIKYVGDNSSVKQLLHFIQIIRSGKFQLFDYGRERNEMFYDNKTPPEYNLSAIDVPMISVSLTKDALVIPEDAEALLLQFTKITPKHVIIPGNHVDFLFDPKAIHLIKDEILSYSKR